MVSLELGLKILLAPNGLVRVVLGLQGLQQVNPVK